MSLGYSKSKRLQHAAIFQMEILLNSSQKYYSRIFFLQHINIVLYLAAIGADPYLYRIISIVTKCLRRGQLTE